MRTIIATILIAFCIIGCGQPIANVIKERQFKVGEILSLSGNDLSSISQAMQQGIDLATEEINSQGGISGQQVHIIYEDDQLDSVKAVGAATKLTSTDHVSASFIAGANTAKAASAVFDQQQTPMIVLWDVNDDLKNAGDYTYGIGFSTEGAGHAMAERLYAQGTRTVGIVRHQDEWSQLIAGSFVKRFKELGGGIVADESVAVGATDFRSTLLKMHGADAIYAPLVGQLDVFFIQARQSGYTGIITTGDSMTQDAIDAAKGAAEGVQFTQVTAKGAKLDHLHQLYVQKYGKEPELLVFTALGYDGMMTLKDAAERSSDDPLALHKALYDVKDLDGAAGTVTIDSTGFAQKFEPLFVVKDGKMVEE